MTVSQDNYYDKLWHSKDWGEREINLDEKVRSQAITRFINQYIAHDFKDRELFNIIDVGCGRGWLTSLLSTYGKVIGIDPTSAAIKRARELYPDLVFFNTNLKLFLEKTTEKQFDLVCSSEVIEHIPDEQKGLFLKQIHRSLKSGGYAILTTPRGELWNDWENLNKEKQPVEEWITEKDLIHLCKRVGFEVISHNRIFLPGFRYNWATTILNSKIIRKAMSPDFGQEFFIRIKAYFGIYQVILLRKEK